MRQWIRSACDSKVVKRAFACAVVVGTILLVINHGNAIVNGEMNTTRTMQACLTVLVPYCVSTWSSVQAMGNRLDSAD